MSSSSFFSKEVIIISTITLLIGGVAGFFISKSLSGGGIQALCDKDSSGIKLLRGSEANNLIKAYREVYPDSTFGVSVSVAEWRAINNTIVDQDCDLSSTSGFKLYYGLDTTSTNPIYYAMCYPISDNLRTNRNVTGVNAVVGLEKKYTEPCPHFCD